MEQKEVALDEDGEEWPYIYPPFMNIFEGLYRFYFFNYWCGENKYPPADECHNRVHDTKEIENSNVECPGVKRMRLIHKECRGMIC